MIPVEQTHLVVFRKASDLDDLAPFERRRTPVQAIGCADKAAYHRNHPLGD